MTKQFTNLSIPHIDSRESNEPSKDVEIIELARKRLSSAIEENRDNIKESREDEAFVAGEQWDKVILARRMTEHRPCLTLDQISPVLDKAIGQFKQRKFSIQCKATEKDTQIPVANLYTSIIKHIEERSRASTLYSKQYENIAIKGFSDFRIVTEYEKNSFNQELVMLPINHRVYWDTDCLDDFKTDARWCFITALISRRSFEEMYPDAVPGDLQDTFEPAEVHRNQVRISEYYYKEQYNETLALMSDNSVVKVPSQKDPDYEDYKKKIIQNANKGIFEVERRTEICDRVIWCLMTNAEILEKRELPISSIPVIHTPGKVVRNSHHKKQEISLVRRAKDAQRNYNYWRSAATEAVALAPKAPILVTPEMIEGFKVIYDNLHTENRPYLPYNPNPEGKEPHRLDTGVVPQGEVLLAQAAASDIKACLGVDLNLDKARTGEAVDALTLPQDDGQYWMTDNVKTAMENCGRTLVEYIPWVYDTERDLSVPQSDGSDQFVTINKTVGDKTYNEVTSAKLGIIVDIESGTRTMRQIQAKFLWQILNTIPQEGAKIMDLICEAMDVPDADDLASRFRKFMNPAIVPGKNDQERQAQKAMMEAQAAPVKQQQQIEAQKMMIDEHKNQIAEQGQKLDAMKIANDKQLREMELKFNFITNKQNSDTQAKMQQTKEAMDAKEIALKEAQVQGNLQHKSDDTTLKAAKLAGDHAVKQDELRIKDFSAMSQHIKAMTPEVIEVDKKDSKK